MRIDPSPIRPAVVGRCRGHAAIWSGCLNRAWCTVIGLSRVANDPFTLREKIDVGMNVFRAGRFLRFAIRNFQPPSWAAVITHEPESRRGALCVENSASTLDRL